MFIKQVNELDNFSGEADVVVSDGQYELVCYYHPAENVDIGVKVQVITSMFAKNILRALRQEYLIKKDDDYYSYHLQGKVIDTNIPKVCIGNIQIELDHPLPKDIYNGDFVCFDVERLNSVIDRKLNNNLS